MTTIRRSLALAAAMTVASLPTLCHAAPGFPWRWHSAHPFAFLTAAGRIGDAYLVVGENGLIGTIRDGKLSIEASPVRAHFRNLWVAPTGEAFIVASTGVVLSRSVNGSLSVLPVNETECHDCSSSQIVGRTAVDVYASGSSGVAHFDGHQWRRVDLGKDSYSPRLFASGTSIYAIADATAWKLSGDTAQSVPALKRFQSFWVARDGTASFGIDEGRLYRIDGKNALDLKVQLPWNAIFAPSTSAPLIISGNAMDQVLKIVGNRVTSLGPQKGIESIVAVMPEGQGARALTQSGAEVSLERGTAKVLHGPALSAGHWDLEHRIGGPFPDACAEKAERQQPTALPKREGVTVVSWFSRAGLHYAITQSRRGTAVEQYDGHAWTTLLEPAQMAQWQAEPRCIGGASDGTTEVWVAAGSFAISLSGKRYARHALGWSGEDFFSSGRDLFLYTEHQFRHWDGSRWSPEPTFAERITAVCENSGNAYLVDDHDEYRQLRVRRSSGYFAGATSDGSLSASLAGDEFGVVPGATGSRTAAFVKTKTHASEGPGTPGQVAFHGSRGWSWVTTDSGLGMGPIAARGKWFIGAGADGFLYRGAISPVESVTLTREQRMSATAIDFTGPSEAYIASSTSISKWDGNRLTPEFESVAAGHRGHDWSELKIRAFGRYKNRTYAFGSDDVTLVFGSQARWVPANLDDPVTGYRKLGDSVPAGAMRLNPFGESPKFEPCAALVPTPDVLVLVSCEGGWVAVLKDDQWRSHLMPVQTPLLGATCIDDDACYVFTKLGAFRAQPSDL